MVSLLIGALLAPQGGEAPPAMAPADDRAPPSMAAVASAPARDRAPPARPPRVEALAAVGLSVGGTSWRGDALGYGSLTLALRLFRVLTPFFMTRLGYGAVDQRLLTFISVGLQGGFPIRDRAWPYLRVGFVHQHEESLAAVADQPGGALLGIGTGIRHRAGIQVGLGCDVVLLTGSRGQLLLGPEVMASYLGYSSGPSVYGAVGLHAGGSLHIF